MLSEKMLNLFKFAAALAVTASAHGNHQESFKEGPHKALWYNSLPGDGGTQADSVFSGISTFGRVAYHPCLASDERKYDIAFLGVPFDTGTSYRPGARFGPQGIRQGSRRLNLYGGFNVPLQANPFNS
jgi:agmatinase